MVDNSLNALFFVWDDAAKDKGDMEKAKFDFPTDFVWEDYEEFVENISTLSDEVKRDENGDTPGKTVTFKPGTKGPAPEPAVDLSGGDAPALGVTPEDLAKNKVLLANAQQSLQGSAPPEAGAGADGKRNVATSLMNIYDLPQGRSITSGLYFAAGQSGIPELMTRKKMTFRTLD